MKAFLYRLLIEHWQRKLLALALAIIIWIMVSYSMTATKTVSNVPVRVTHLQSEKTIETMQANGLLGKKVNLVLTGNRNIIERLSAKDLEIVVDADGKPDQWVETLHKKHLVSLNADIDLAKAISRISPQEFSIKQSKLITEKIPILISQPIGEAPKGYQYLDVWPYQLHVTIKGPEETIKRLKARGEKLTFNLSDITQAELDALQSAGGAEEISYFVPNSWKKVSLPQLSDSLVEIDDPQAKTLRIDFARQDLIPIDVPIPVTFFSPLQHGASLAANKLLTKKNGLYLIAIPLYAQGVSRLFLNIVKEMMQIVIIAAPKSERSPFLWNTQFVYPHELEDRYVAKVLSETPGEQEEYLRNRFRNYMNRFRLYTADKKKLSLESAAGSISCTSSS